MVGLLFPGTATEDMSTETLRSSNHLEGVCEQLDCCGFNQIHTTWSPSFQMIGYFYAVNGISD